MYAFYALTLREERCTQANEYKLVCATQILQLLICYELLTVNVQTFVSLLLFFVVGVFTRLHPTPPTPLLCMGRGPSQ